VSRGATTRLPAKKKTLHATERDTPRVQQERLKYGDKVAAVDVQRLKFVDEAGVNLALTRLYGRAPTGARAVGSVPWNYGPNVTLLGALGLTGLDALMTVDGATDGDVFRAFVEQVLCPTLQAGDIVVMDNLRAHKVAGIEAAIMSCGARLIYLPPYSPDLSPIEQCWSKLKTILRRVGARTREVLEVAITDALGSITATDALAWFTHCGYTVI
jgi:transposase